MDYLIAKRLIALSVAICFVTSAPLLLSPSTNAFAQTQVLERYKITGAEGKLTGKILFEGEAPIKKANRHVWRPKLRQDFQESFDRGFHDG